MLGGLNDRIVAAASRATRRPGAVLAVAAALTAVGLWQARGIRFDSDIAELLPDDNPDLLALRRLEKKFSGIASFTVVLTADRLDRARAFAPVLAAELEKSALVDQVDYRRDVQFFRDRALLYLSVEDLERLRDALEDKIDEQKRKNNPLYIELDDESAAKATTDTLDDLAKKYDEYAAEGGRDEYHVHPDGRSLALIVYPTGSSARLSHLREIRREVERIVRATLPRAGDPGMRFDVGGDAVNKLEEYEIIIRDVFGPTTWAALALIVLMIAFHFRHPLGVLLVAAPLGMSIAWTFGVTALTIGRLNVVTGFLFAVLFGLGIDYGIVLFSRYREERRGGAPPRAAIDRTVGDAGRGVMTGATTTSAAFLSLMITDFRGFTEFGFIAGIGVLFALASFLVVMPSLMLVAERMGVLRVAGAAADRHAAGSADAAAPLFRRPGVIVCALAVLTAVFAWLACGVEFEHDTGKMRPPRVTQNPVRKRISEIFRGGITPLGLLAESHDELRAAVAALRARASAEGDASRVDKIVSLRGTLVPDRQPEKMAVVGEIARLLADEQLELAEGAAHEKIEELRRLARVAPFSAADLPGQVRRALRGPGFGDVPLALVYYRGRIRDIANAERIRREVCGFQSDAVVDVAAVLRDAGVRARVFVEGADRAEIRTEPDDEARAGAALAAFRVAGRAAIARVATAAEASRDRLGVPGALRGNLLALAAGGVTLSASGGARAVSPPRPQRATSPELVVAEVVNVLLHDGRIAFAVALAAVFVLVLLDFRSLRDTALALLPLGFGLVWTLGAMVALGWKLNFMNFVVLPALLGMGVDYGVHFYHRARAGGPGSLARAHRAMLGPVFWCVATTMAGFGNMALAHHLGLRSLGLLAITGLAACFVAAAYGLFAVLYLLEARAKRSG